MANAAISARGLSKQYWIGSRPHAYGRLTETLWETITSPVRRRPREMATEFWALRDVSFDVLPGSVTGVIGRNGAGKSTLLKVLSRITEPTAGTVELRGRIGSLLEVGTGFHPELTGRENIFMSGAVLGMRRAAINRRFDEIVDFAGTEEFLDTPVKRYSSGMQVRLGFAVAAHLEPEILIIDEVLAVGDADFQKKCLGKMSDLSRGGRTIIFVSHDMHSVLRLCEDALLLEAGRVISAGPSHEVVRSYLEAKLGPKSALQWNDPASAPGDEVARLRSIRAIPARGGHLDEFDIREPLDVEVEYWTAGIGPRRPLVMIDVFNGEGVCLFSLSDETSTEWRSLSHRPGAIRSTVRIPGNFFAEGLVTMNVALATYDPITSHALQLDAIVFHVVDRTAGDGARGHFAGGWTGVVRPKLEWTVNWVADQELVSAKT